MNDATSSMAALEKPALRRLASAGWLLVATLFIARLLPFIVQQGMFFDGVTYAAISRNLASGVGDPWHLVFSRGTEFNEHPPLAFLLESYCFRIFGDHFWVEKLYSALTGLGTAVIIAATWRRLAGRQSPAASYAWLPICFWILIPAWSWIYDSNMLENTVGLFANLAVYAALCASEGRAGRSKWILLAAISVTAAVFGKGPVGLYPIVTPMVAGLTLHRQNIKRSLLTNAIYLLLVIFAVALVLMQEGAFQSFSVYLRQQVFASVAGHREITTSFLGRYTILWKMAGQLVVPAAVAGAFVWVDRRRDLNSMAAANTSSLRAANNAIDIVANKPAIWFCLITAVSASFPIMLSPKQFAHYAFPSYSFYTLALAWWCYPALTRLTTSGNLANKMRFIGPFRWASVTALLLIGAVSATLAGRTHRDRDILHDTFALGEILSADATVGFQKRIGEKDVALNSHDFALQSYLSRWQDIALDRSGKLTEFLLMPANPPQQPVGYDRVAIDLIGYRLYRRQVAAEASIQPETAEPSDSVAAPIHRTRRR